MNNITFDFQRNVFLYVAAIASGLTVSLTTVNGLPAQAETVNNSSPNNQQTINSNILNQDLALTAEEIYTSPKAFALNTQSEATEQTEQTEIPVAEAKNQPVPGTTETSASVLLEQPKTKGQVAQFGDVEPSRTTRGSGYIGIGGNLGVAGGTAVGDLGFTLFARFGLGNNFSVRPALIFSNDFDILLPLTYDFRIDNTPILPFVGGGLLITTGSGNVGGLITGGIDFPITRQFTATGRLNVGFTTKDAALGFIFGVGYNFAPGFVF